jgi:hypothetical protein
MSPYKMNIIAEKLNQILIMPTLSLRMSSARITTNPINGGNESKVSRFSMSADKAQTMREKTLMGSQPHTGSTQNFVTFGLNNINLNTTKNNSQQAEGNIQEINRPVKVFDENSK